jgi:hypothetical protein
MRKDGPPVYFAPTTNPGGQCSARPGGRKKLLKDSKKKVYQDGPDSGMDRTRAGPGSKLARSSPS